MDAARKGRAGTDRTERSDVAAAPPSTSVVLARVARWMVPAVSVLVVPFVVDRLDPTSEPRVDLTGGLALAAWVAAETGRTRSIVVIATALVAVLVTRPGPSTRRRLREVAVVGAVSIVVLYGGSLLNDHVVKPAWGVARPDIVRLHEASTLGMEVDAFYDLSPEGRSDHLESIASDTGFGEIVMRPQVRDHWIEETAFSRPSGHSLAAMTFATMYVSIAVAFLAGWRSRVFHLLVPWAVCVCLSRPILGVHWPVDVVIGGLVGVVVGGAGFVVVHRLLGAGAAEAEESGAGVQPPST